MAQRSPLLPPQQLCPAPGRRSHRCCRHWLKHQVERARARQRHCDGRGEENPVTMLGVPELAASAGITVTAGSSGSCTSSIRCSCTCNIPWAVARIGKRSRPQRLASTSTAAPVNHRPHRGPAGFNCRPQWGQSVCSTGERWWQCAAAYRLHPAPLPGSTIGAGQGALWQPRSTAFTIHAGFFLNLECASLKRLQCGPIEGKVHRDQRRDFTHRQHGHQDQ